MPRTILFTGKGGVGKTTTAAATAVAAARAGLRTIVLSTDPAHSLGDVLDAEPGDDPVEIEANLDAQQIDAQARLETHWGEIRDQLVAIFDWGGLARVESEEMAVMPGLDEVFALAEVKAHHASDRYDVIVIDCAPTAETLRLLSLPEILSSYMERLFPIGRQLAKTLRPLLGRVTSAPLPDDAVLGAVQRLWERLRGVREVLTDGSQCSVRLVLTPDRMVVAEARRTFTYLCLFGYSVDAVIANRLIPEHVSDPFFAPWKEAQAEHLKAVYEAFAPVPVLEAPLWEREPIGVDVLESVAASFYEDSEPWALLSEESPVRVVERGDGLVLDLRLPFVARHDLDLGRRDGELFIKVGPYRRTFVLPPVLERRTITDARFVDDRLEVTFS